MRVFLSGFTNFLAFSNVSITEVFISSVCFSLVEVYVDNELCISFLWLGVLAGLGCYKERGSTKGVNG